MRAVSRTACTQARAARSLEHSPTLDHSCTSAKTRTLEHEHKHEVARQSVRAVSRTAYAKPACGTFLQPCEFACAWMALSARNASPWLLASYRDFEPPEHGPLTSARAHTCTAVFTRASCVQCNRSREHEKRIAGGRAKMSMCKKKSIRYQVHSNMELPCGPYNLNQSVWN